MTDRPDRPAVPSVADIARDAAVVAERFRSGQSHAFAFGDGGVPEAVITSYDQYDDLGGEEKLGRYSAVLTPHDVGRQLTEMVEAMRRGTFGAPVLWGGGSEPELVVMSTRQYRTLRGDDEPPPGVVDDPTVRSYPTEPAPGSRPFSLDEWAKDDPFTQEILADIRREERESDD